jgi:hypothetical protein
MLTILKMDLHSYLLEPLVICGHHELFVIPGTAPWCASSRRQIRQRPNFR